VKGLLGLLFLVLFVWISLAATAKRLHDLNLSDAWLVAVIGGPILLVLVLFVMAAIAGGIVVISDRLADVAFGGYAVLTLVLVCGWFVIAFGFPLMIGFWPGTVGPNRFGPDPLG